MCDDRFVVAQSETAIEASEPDVAQSSIGESRWPPAIALVLFMGLNIGLRVWLPHEGAIRVPWLLPTMAPTSPSP